LDNHRRFSKRLVSQLTVNLGTVEAASEDKISTGLPPGNKQVDVDAGADKKWTSK
jgi:hypothetical protein